MNDDSVIKITNLTKDYKTCRAVVGLSLEVKKGDIYGFLGPNGAGKTTAINALLGFIRPTAGKIEIMGEEDYSTMSKVRIGCVLESSHLYSYLTGRENVKILSDLSGGVKKEEIDDVLEIVGLKEKADEKVNDYSLGMKRRLGIAQALLPTPEILILDEPFIGLDPKGMKEMRELILNKAKKHNITIFISSHLLNEIENLCDKVGIINNGKLIYEGQVKDLIDKDNILLVKTDNNKKAAEILIPCEFISKIDIDNGNLKIKVEKECNYRIVNVLVQNDIKIHEITNQRNTLEDIFIKLTEEKQK